jgi:hypothetical protein
MSRPRNSLPPLPRNSLGARLPGEAHVEQQETGDAADERQQRHDQHVIADEGGDGGGHGQRQEGQGPGQAVDTVGHVDGVDQANDGRNGEGRRQPAQLDIVAEEAAELGDLGAVDIDDQQGCYGLGREARHPVEVHPVVEDADADDQQHGQHQALGHGRPGHQRRAGHGGHDDRQAADNRGWRRMMFALARRVIEQAEFRREMRQHSAGYGRAAEPDDQNNYLVYDT